MGALEEVKDLAEAVARRRSLTLWDVEMGGRPGSSVVRVFVQSESGLDLDTMAEVSEEISRGLDLRDPIPGRYTLEVSTPGLERQLRTPEHFSRSVGERAVVKTTEIVYGNSHRVEGTIVAASSDDVTLQFDGGDGVELPFGKIKQARTVFDW